MLAAKIGALLEINDRCVSFVYCVIVRSYSHDFLRVKKSFLGTLLRCFLYQIRKVRISNESKIIFQIFNIQNFKMCKSEFFKWGNFYFFYVMFLFRNWTMIVLPNFLSFVVRSNIWLSPCPSLFSRIHLRMFIWEFHFYVSLDFTMSTQNSPNIFTYHVLKKFHVTFWFYI